MINWLTVLLPIFAANAQAQTPFTVDGSTIFASGGSVGIRTSSPATNLDVNGSAQFGSGATKSTFTASGLLKLTASGVQWADGTTSTTAASSGGGSGSATLSGSNVWTGSNTFTSASTTSVLGISNFCIEISSIDAVQVASVTFSNLMSSVAYMVQYDVRTSSTMMIWGGVINQDLGTSYNEHGGSEWNSTIWSWGCTTPTDCAKGMSLLRYNGNSWGAGTEFFGTLKLKTSYAAARVIWSNDSSSGKSPSFGANRTISAGSYDGAVGPTYSISFITTNNDYTSTYTNDRYFSGHLELWQCGYRSR